MIPRTNFLSLDPSWNTSPSFLRTHRVSLYANEATTTSCPSLLANDRSLSPNTSVICFRTLGLLTFRDQWSWRTAWLLLFFGQRESHMTHTWLCAVTSLQHPTPPTQSSPTPQSTTSHHVNFSHFNRTRFPLNYCEWVNCCHVRSCGAILNYFQNNENVLTLSFFLMSLQSDLGLEPMNIFVEAEITHLRTSLYFFSWNAILLEAYASTCHRLRWVEQQTQVLSSNKSSSTIPQVKVQTGGVMLFFLSESWRMRSHLPFQFHTT